MDETQRKTKAKKNIYALNSINLCKNDPLSSLLYKISPNNAGWIILIVYIIYGFFALGLGSLVSLHYESIGSKFVSILDYREFPSSLLLYLVIIPAIWILYYWQPIAFAKIFELLADNNVFQTEEDSSYQDAAKNGTAFAGRGALLP